MPSVLEEQERLKKTGKIDGILGGKHVGKTIDFYNDMEKKKRESNFLGEINARNNYFLKLFMFKVDALKSGHKNESYKSSSILV